MKTRSSTGLLIVIEGIDGAGKSTQARLLLERMEARGLPVVKSREPTDGRWGRLLRESATTGRLSLEEEVATFIKDRKEHVATLIQPSLAAGKAVVLDRYYFSTVAYQGARGMDPAALLRRNERFAPQPDLLILLDVEPKGGLSRVRTRGDKANAFEKTRALQRARDIFLSIQKPYLVRLDARQPLEVLQEIIWREVTALWAQRLLANGAATKATVSLLNRMFSPSAR